VLEEHLYAGEHEDGAAAEMYPGYLVLLTSAAGATLTHRLAGAGRLSRVAAWALHCVFAAKLAMLLVPEARRCSCCDCSMSSASSPWRGPQPLLVQVGFRMIRGLTSHPV